MEIINDVNGLFEFQDLGARTELKNKANLVQSKNLFDIKEYLKLLSTQQNPVTNGLLDSFDNDTFTITATKNDCYTNIWSSIERSIYKIT